MLRLSQCLGRIPDCGSEGRARRHLLVHQLGLVLDQLGLRRGELLLRRQRLELHVGVAELENFGRGETRAPGRSGLLLDSSCGERGDVAHLFGLQRTRRPHLAEHLPRFTTSIMRVPASTDGGRASSRLTAIVTKTSATSPRPAKT